MDNRIFENYIENFTINLFDCKFIGRGHNGVVYLLPEGKIIKVCFNEESCKKEYEILRRIKSNRYFPKAYFICGNYMIRDYVRGIPLSKHIKHNGLDREMAIKLLDLLTEFMKLKFSKIDIRCKDIVVKPDGELMVIDPKKFFTKQRDYPRHLAKGIRKLGVLDIFMDVMKNDRPKLYKAWGSKIRKYLWYKNRV